MANKKTKLQKRSKEENKANMINARIIPAAIRLTWKRGKRAFILKKDLYNFVQNTILRAKENAGSK